MRRTPSPISCSSSRTTTQQAQTSAIAAVGAIGGSLAKKALLRCLKSSDDAVVEAAEEALEVLGETSDL